MKVVIVVIASLLLLSLGLAACNGTSSNSSNSPAQSSATAPTLNQVFSQHPKLSVAMCEQYYNLVNQGWTDPEIYTQLKDGGAFDGYYGNSGSTMFHALIKWCFHND